MSIKIEKTPSGYLASVTPPHGKGRYWQTDKPMTADELVEALKELGCHQTDIGDAFYFANPNWLDDVK